MLNRFSFNAAANVFSGIVAATYQLVVMAMAAATWSGTEFAAWGLAMSLAVIAPVVSANLSSVVTRRLVEVRHSGSSTSETVIVLAGRQIGRRLAVLAFGSLFCVGCWIHVRSAPEALTIAGFVLLLGALLVTNCWMLLWQVRFGQYYADEHNWWPALTIACARVGGLFGMFFVLKLVSQDLTTVAFGLCAGSWMALLVAQLVLPCPGNVKAVSILPTALEIRDEFWRSIRVLYGFAFGAVSSILILYSIPPLIALIAPQKFNAFYLASTFNAVALGALSAVILALLAPFTRWRSTGASRALQYVVLFSPVVCAGVSLFVLSICWFALGFILEAVTTRTAEIADVRFFLALLGLQTIVRTSAAGYATFVSSAGTSRQMVVPLMIEMILIFAIAFPLGWRLGIEALLLGMTFASLVGSQFCSKVVATLSVPVRTAAHVVFAPLITAQLIGSAFWLWIVGGV